MRNVCLLNLNEISELSGSLCINVNVMILIIALRWQKTMYVLVCKNCTVFKDEASHWQLTNGSGKMFCKFSKLFCKFV